MVVPLLEELQFYTSKAESGVKLSKEVKLQLAKGPKNREVRHLIDLARPYASGLKLLKAALTKQCNVSFRISLMLTITVFIVSTALHLHFMYIYHRYNLASKLFPSLLDKTKTVRAKSMM